MELNIKKNISYIQFVRNEVGNVKRQYQEGLLSFSVLEYHEKVQFMARCKRQIYDLKFQEFIKDRIWLYLNDYIDFKTLQNKQ